MAFYVTCFMLVSTSSCTLTPRLYLESLSSPGCYTVIPVLGKKLLDAAFHLDRLIYGYEQQYGSENDDSKVTLYDQALSKIKAVVHDTQSTRAGIVTLAMFNDKQGDRTAISFDAIYNVMDPTIYTSTKSPPSLYADLHEYQRKLPLAKDIKWPIERKIIEKARKHKDLAESIMYLKDVSYKGTMYKNVLTEGLTSNIFIIDKDDYIVTCPNELVLPGSMSKIIKGLSTKYNLRWREDIIVIDELKSWKAVFLSSSCKPIHVLEGIYKPASFANISLSPYINDEFHSFHTDVKAKETIDFLKLRLSEFFKLATSDHIHLNRYGVSWE